MRGKREDCWLSHWNAISWSELEWIHTRERAVESLESELHFFQRERRKANLASAWEFYWLCLCAGWCLLIHPGGGNLLLSETPGTRSYPLPAVGQEGQTWLKMHGNRHSCKTCAKYSCTYSAHSAASMQRWGVLHFLTTFAEKNKMEETFFCL